MNIEVVSCTQCDENAFDKTPLGKSLIKHNLPLKVFFNNENGMPMCYNKALHESNADYILFVHDDVFLNDVFLIEKLEKAFNKFDVVGLAGSSNFSIERTPICWHNSPKESWSGAVLHPMVDKHDDKFIMTTFGETPKQVVIVDGLFIAINRKKVIEANVRFNEAFDFHFYDTAFCIDATLAKLSIGTVPILCTHMSHGGGIKTPEYAQLQKKFINIYKRG